MVSAHSVIEVTEGERVPDSKDRVDFGFWLVIENILRLKLAAECKGVDTKYM